MQSVSAVTFAAVFTMALSATHTQAQTATRNTLLGFTAFPYDLTAEAITKTHQIILPNSDLYAIHMDQCLPWSQALANAPFPAWLQRDWDDIDAQIPATHAVYVAMTPTAMDRRKKAEQCGDAEGKPKSLPSAIATARYDAAAVKTAYVNYLRRVIQRFKPTYVNIGVEISEMALLEPALWPQYQALYLHAYGALKREFPTLQIGIELVLQSLMHPAVSKLVKPAVEASDYIGISFYPYGSNFGVALGAPPLGPPPDQWRKPLEWLRTYTAKPIAICETGYTTKNILLRETNLTATGSDAAQLQFTKDIIEFAKKHNYLFLVWFVPVDYERLLNKISVGEAKHVWVNAGLHDRDLKPKSAWAEWRKFHQVPKSAAAVKVIQSTPRVEGAGLATSAETAAVANAIAVFSFGSPDDLFRSSKGGIVAMDKGPGEEPALRWSIKYPKDWVLLEKRVRNGALAKAESVEFSIRSDKKGMVLFRLDPNDGGSFHEFVEAAPEWRKVSLRLRDLKPEKKNQRGLQPEKIERMWLGDGGGEDGAKGTRTIWFSPIVFR